MSDHKQRPPENDRQESDYEAPEVQDLQCDRPTVTAALATAG